jgi:hypothetical protein
VRGSVVIPILPSFNTLCHSLQAVTRLFRMVLDVTSPAFNIEDRQWRSSVIDVFYHYFRATWADERVCPLFGFIATDTKGFGFDQRCFQEEIRLAVDTFSSNLLPAHFEAISLCWNESLSKAPIAERIKLISFLSQLHPHFPSWNGMQMISTICYH